MTESLHSEISCLLEEIFYQPYRYYFLIKSTWNFVRVLSQSLNH